MPDGTQFELVKQSKGAFVVMVGPDGVGKTTVARAMIELYGGPTAYFHFRPRIFARLAPRPPDVSAAAVDKEPAGGWRVLGWLRLLRTFVQLWVVHLTAVDRARRRGALVVADRWVYPYLVQPRSVRFHGPRLLAWIAIRALPRPDLIVNLTAPRELILSRKAELTAEQIDRELAEWAKVVPTPRLRTFDTTRDPQEVAHDILRNLTGRDRLRPGLHTPFPPASEHLLVPTSSRAAALAGLSLYTACKPRSLLALRLMRMGVRLAGPRVLPGRAVEWSPPIELETWNQLLERWHTELGHFDDLALYRRRQASRAGLALLLLGGGTPVAFVKVRSGESSDLDNERHALDQVLRFSPHAFRVSPPLAWGRVRDASYLALGALPPTFHRPLAAPPLEAILDDVQGSLAGLPRPRGTPEHWLPMHGDFTPWNLRRFRGEPYLIDWEDAGWGPPGADEILYRASNLALRGQDRGLPDAPEARAFWDDRLRLRRLRAREGRDADVALLDHLVDILSSTNGMGRVPHG